MRYDTIVLIRIHVVLVDVETTISECNQADKIGQQCRPFNHS